MSQSQRLQGERGQYNNEEYSEQQMRFSSLLFFYEVCLPDELSAQMEFMVATVFYRAQSRLFLEKC